MKTRMDVLGVTIGDTGVLAMFKPVSRARPAADLPEVRRAVDAGARVRPRHRLVNTAPT